ncbi:MAG: prolyl oligopeptidase family serine peptidase [Halobacteriaceae archaeon]
MPDLAADTFYDYRQITDVAVAPDGDRAAYVVAESAPDDDDRRQSIFVVPTDGSEDPHRLTRASDAGSPAWSPDGSRLAVAATREEDVELAVDPPEDEDDDGDDEPESQVWVFDLERGGDARQVTAFDEGVSEFDWGPDGERLVAAARDPTDEEQAYLDQLDEDAPIEIDRLQHKVNGSGYLDEVATYLFIVDVTDRTTVRLDDAYDAPNGSRFPALAPDWSPDGDRIAFIAQRDLDHPDDRLATDVYTIRPDGTGLTRLTDGSYNCGAPAWGPDGDRLAFTAGDPRNWYRPTEVRVADHDTGDHWTVSASLDRTLGWGNSPTWLEDDAILVTIADEGLTRFARLDPSTDDPTRVLDAQGRHRNAALWDHGDDTIATVLSHPETGADLHAIETTALEADDATFTQLTSVNDAVLADADAPTCVRLTWENSDGTTIEGFAYLPPGFDPEDPEPAPLVASIHGGPMSYDTPSFDFDYLYWTNNGYIVLRTNYRGSTSYGRAFSESLRGTRGDLEVDDVLTGVDELHDRNWIDEDALYVTGFSYGGITTAHIVTQDDRFDAAAAEHGVYDFYSTFGTDDNHIWHEDEFGLPWENLDTYREISALTDVGEVDTPLLVTAGEQDWRCPPTQAEQLYVSVKKQGVDARLVVYQNEHHNIGDPDRAIHRLEELRSWFEEH